MNEPGVEGNDGWSPFEAGVAALGVVLFCVAALYHFLEASSIGEIWGPALAFLIDGVPALALVYGAVRLHRSDLNSTADRRVLLWCLAGLVGFVAVTATSILIRQAEGRVVGEAVFEVLLATTGGSLAGFLAGYFNARARHDAKQAERASRTLSFVNGVLRHDLTNDLHAIEAEAELLAAEAPDDPAVEDRQAAIQQEVHDAAELIASAGDIAETLTGDGDFEAVDLVELVEEAVDRRGADDGVTVTTDLPERVLVVGNAGLRSVVDNLVENAVEHNDADEPRIEVQVTDDAGIARLEVRDNGTGIPDDQKEELFEPRESGTGGGGLYLTSTLVDRYGGSLDVEDNDPRGAVFAVELPTANGSAG